MIAGWIFVLAIPLGQPCLNTQVTTVTIGPFQTKRACEEQAKMLVPTPPMLWTCLNGGSKEYDGKYILLDCVKGETRGNGR
jgi:hypothetical protein